MKLFKYFSFILVLFLSIRGNDALGQINNYVNSQLVHSAGRKTEADLTNLTKDELSQDITYFDGLGRVRQSVAKEASPNGKDIIIPVEYDSRGRVARSYLPYESNSIDGQYRANAFTEQSQFYNQPNDDIADDAAPFSQTVFENAPSSRIIEQGAPGSAWQPGPGAFTTLLKTSSSNDGSEYLMKLNYNYQSQLPYSLGRYAAGELAATETTDENGIRTISYTNSEGLLVIKKNANANITTYYVYDDFGKLRAIIQPKGVEELTNQFANWNTGLTLTFLDKWCFYYRYDSRSRIIEKRVPGGARTYLVYNAKDQVVATATSGDWYTGTYYWQVIKYDVLGRPILTGYVDLDRTQDDVQYAIDNQPSNSQLYEVRTPGIGYGYSLTQSYPGLPLSAVQTLTYYDDYDYPQLTNRPFVAENGVTNAFDRLKGFVTGHGELIVGTQQWVITKSFFDAKGNQIQSRTDNALGGVTRNTSKINFLGESESELLTHSANGINNTIRNVITSDHAGRVLRVTQQMDYGIKYPPIDPVLVSSNTYNALGALVDKKLHSTDNGVNFLQSVDYRYNIRGWLTSINSKDLPANGDGPDVEQDLFGLELKYETPNQAGLQGGVAQYNGMISQALWRTRNTQTGNVLRGYSYKYDAMNRINAADYSTYEVSALTGAWEWGKSKSDYSVSSVSYDKNGNILNLRRRGRLSALSVTNNPQFGDLDILAYKYDGNRLIAVDDAAAVSVLPHDFEDNGQKYFTSGAEEYKYDDAGNLIQDLNKGIADISYNQLNQPTLISFTNGNKIEFTYTADGQKVKKIVTPAGQPAVTTDYVEGFVYEKGVLAFGPMPEGRVLYNGATGNNYSWKYEYFITDQLGNLRFTFRDLGGTATQRSTASMEPANASDEETKFKRVAETRLRDAVHARSGDYVARLSKADGTSMGPSRTIPVHAGDSIYAEVYGRYDRTHRAGLVKGAVLAAAVGTTGPTILERHDNLVPTAKRQRFPQLNFGITLTPGLLGLRTSTSQKDELPVAYLRCQAFTRDSQLVATHLQRLERQASDEWQQLKTGFTADSTGYVVVTLENESNQPAYFDDLQLRPIDLAEVQENHYDPFGLNLVGIESSTSRNSKFQFGGKEKQEEFGLNWNDHGARFYDPQLGRWHVPDPLADFAHSESPYAAFSNNSVNNADPSGMISATGFVNQEYENPGWYTLDGDKDANGRQLATYSPSIHSQEDLAKAGMSGTYIAENISGNLGIKQPDGTYIHTATYSGNSNGNLTVGLDNATVTPSAEQKAAAGISSTKTSGAGDSNATSGASATGFSPMSEQSAALLTLALAEYGTGSGSGVAMVGPMDSEHDRAEGRQLAYDRNLQAQMGGDMNNIGNPGTSLMLVRGSLEGLAFEYTGFKIASIVAAGGVVALRAGSTASAAEGTFGTMMEAGEAARYAEYWRRYSPKYVTPGNTRLDWFRFGSKGNFEASRVIYDKFGRQIYRVDFTDHLRAINHVNPHLHEYIYSDKFAHGLEITP